MRRAPRSGIRAVVTAAAVGAVLLVSGAIGVSAAQPNDWKWGTLAAPADYGWGPTHALAGGTADAAAVASPSDYAWGV